MPESTLEISKYRFTLQAQEKITLPAYKGSAFHGGFGHALRNISPTWYRYFYEAGQGNSTDWPKPFVILPPLDEKESYQQGEQFHCELTLFGEATQHYSICQAAIEYLGMQMGIGYERGKYQVLDITASSPTLAASKSKLNTTAQNSQISLHFPTRLRLKANDRLQKRTPEFQLIMSRLLGRLKTLQLAYSEHGIDTESYRQLIEKSQHIKISNSKVQWDDWDRFSGRQKKWMKFGGLMGDVSYTGDLQPFMEVLKLGEWLHIGGKTSFGLGKYELEMPNEQ